MKIKEKFKKLIIKESDTPHNFTKKSWNANNAFRCVATMMVNK